MNARLRVRDIRGEQYTHGSLHILVETICQDSSMVLHDGPTTVF